MVKAVWFKTICINLCKSTTICCTTDITRFCPLDGSSRPALIGAHKHTHPAQYEAEADRRQAITRCPEGSSAHSTIAIIGLCSWLECWPAADQFQFPESEEATRSRSSVTLHREEKEESLTSQGQESIDRGRSSLFFQVFFLLEVGKLV